MEFVAYALVLQTIDLKGCGLWSMVFLDTLGSRQAVTAQEGPGELEPGVRGTGLAPPLSLHI